MPSNGSDPERAGQGPVAAVAPGIEPRFRALVRDIKARAGYNPAIGVALGIEGSEQADPNLATLTPKLTATFLGGHVEIGWGWQGFVTALDMIEIQVNRGTGYALLTYDTTPGYTDTAPLPATPTKWTYKAIFHIGDSQTGQWSAETAITVGG